MKQVCRHVNCMWFVMSDWHISLRSGWYFRNQKSPSLPWPQELEQRQKFFDTRVNWYVMLSSGRPWLCLLESWERLDFYHSSWYQLHHHLHSRKSSEDNLQPNGPNDLSSTDQVSTYYVDIKDWPQRSDDCSLVGSWQGWHLGNWCRMLHVSIAKKTSVGYLPLEQRGYFSYVTNVAMNQPAMVSIYKYVTHILACMICLWRVNIQLDMFCWDSSVANLPWPGNISVSCEPDVLLHSQFSPNSLFTTFCYTLKDIRPLHICAELNNRGIKVICRNWPSVFYNIKTTKTSPYRV